MRKGGNFYYWIYNFVIKTSLLWSKNIFWKRLCAQRDIINIFSRPFHHHFHDKNINFRYIFHFEYVNKLWMGGVSGVKTYICLLLAPIIQKGQGKILFVLASDNILAALTRKIGNDPWFEHLKFSWRDVTTKPLSILLYVCLILISFTVGF